MDTVHKDRRELIGRSMRETLLLANSNKQQNQRNY